MISESQAASLNFTVDSVTACENRSACAGGGVGHYGVRLTAAPTDVVLVDIANTSLFSVAPVRLTFGPTDWDVVQHITVTAV